MTDSTLKDQVAVVTGGGRGIGKAICLQLASRGAIVAVNYSRSSDAAEATVQEIEAMGGKGIAVCFDVADEGAVEAGIKTILEKFGRIDVLVNNAGIAVDGLLMRTKMSDWQRTIDVNLTGAFVCARAVSRAMMKGRYGRIINISSVIGEAGNAGQVAYAASKSGMFGLTKSLARELASRGITVNAVTPGYIETDMTGQLSEDQTKAILENIPLNRLGNADDVANAVSFLASPNASYVTGQILGVNGGMHM